jgi:hypothetical protein
MLLVQGSSVGSQAPRACREAPCRKRLGPVARPRSANRASDTPRVRAGPRRSLRAARYHVQEPSSGRKAARVASGDAPRHLSDAAHTREVDSEAAPHEPGDRERLVQAGGGVPAPPQRHQALARCGQGYLLSDSGLHPVAYGMPTLAAADGLRPRTTRLLWRSAARLRAACRTSSIAIFTSALLPGMS